MGDHNATQAHGDVHMGIHVGDLCEVNEAPKGSQGTRDAEASNSMKSVALTVSVTDKHSHT